MPQKHLRLLALCWSPWALYLGLVVGVLLPWQQGEAGLFQAHRGFQWLGFALVLVIAGFQCRWLLYKTLLSHNNGCARYAMLGGGVLVVFAIWQAPFSGVALLELSYLLSLGIVAIIVAIQARYWPRLGWALLGGLMALLMLIYAVFAIDHISLVWEFANRHDFGPGFANVRFFADVAVGVMPLALLYVVARPRPSRMAAMLCLAPLTVWWWLLWVSESRAALLGLIAGLLCAIGLFGRAARWPATLLGISAALGLLGWWIINPIGGGGGGGGDAESAFVRDITSSSGRLALWADSLRYAIENFPLGIGPMGFAGDGNLRSAHAHNVFLNIAAEWGLPLALLLLGLLLYGCWVIIRRASTMPNGDKPLYACLVMAFVGAIVNAQFAGSHIIPLSALMLVLASGLVFGYRPANQPPPSERSGPVSIGITLLWGLLMLMLAFSLYAGLELYWLSVDSAQTCFQEQGRAYYYPRFWSQGRLECMQVVEPGHWLFQHW